MSASNQYCRSELAYCSNVHPGERLLDVYRNIEHFVAPVHASRQTEIGAAGLWLSAEAAKDLQRPKELEFFLQHLKKFNLQLLTLNGFPYGNFHQAQVKEKVYQPDWGQQERLVYTMQLARILAKALPAEQNLGTISTLPITYKAWVNKKNKAAVLENLKELCFYLHKLENETGKHIKLCFEMEPDCFLESTEELIHFFCNELAALPQRQYLGICYDVCHQAVMQENIKHSLNAIAAAGISIGKIQISSALQACFSQTDIHQANSLIKHLEQFCEPKYLHQVKTGHPASAEFADLDLALSAARDNKDLTQSDWFIHFHVPIQYSEPGLANKKKVENNSAIGQLKTTQQAIIQALEFLSENPSIKPHLEVETYTWHVLPENIRPKDDKDLVHNIALELDWLEQQLKQRKLLR